MSSQAPTKEISPKLRKTIEKLQTKIKTSPDYEVHQELKAVANRYLRVQDYESAVQLLYVGGELLLENGLSASGADITITLIEVYNSAHMKPDSTNRARIVQLLGMISPEEPNRQRIIHDAVEYNPLVDHGNGRWSAKEGDVQYGDPELHHSIGVLLASEDNVYEAEKHLLLGTKSSPAILSKLLYEYFKEDSPHTAGHYLSRAVLPYLCLSNLRDAQTALNTFVALLMSNGASTVPGIDSTTTSAVAGNNIPPYSTIKGVVIFPSLPHINFLSLLCKACGKGVPEFFLGLKKQYASSLEDVPWDDVFPPEFPSSLFFHLFELFSLSFSCCMFLVLLIPGFVHRSFYPPRLDSLSSTSLPLSIFILIFCHLFYRLFSLYRPVCSPTVIPFIAP